MKYVVRYIRYEVWFLKPNDVEDKLFYKIPVK